MAAAAAATEPSRKTETYTDTKRSDYVRGRAVAYAVRTSLGPRGMDKRISWGDQAQEVINTNDGATILSHMALLQPAARMLTELSRSQDAAATATAPSRKTETYDTKRRNDVRRANFAAAPSVANAVRTSLGPRGMEDKRISSSDQAQEVIITNDGATVLSRMSLLQQPAVRMLAELSRSQDATAGDGTTAPSKPENV